MKGLLIVAMVAGLFLLLYPSVSNYWNSFHASQAVASYTDSIQKMTQSEQEALLEQADWYNREELPRRTQQFKLNDEEKARYNALLNIGDTGIMGYIEIPSIDVSIPIYHGTESDVLQVAVGHLEWTSLPVGGVGTHSVLSGHRGLPSAKLFTDLDKLVVGDLFEIHVLNKTLTYSVDKISIVEPVETSELRIQDDQDLCTLMTCTPYGINSHRLLVRGHRVDNRPNDASVAADATQIDPHMVALALALPILCAFALCVFARRERKPKTGRWAYPAFGKTSGQHVSKRRR